MTHRATRVQLIRQILRAAERTRLARIVDKLEPDDFSDIAPELDAFELRRAASVLFDDERVSRSVQAHKDATLRLLLYNAADDDAERALEHLTPARAATLLLGLPPSRRDALIERLDVAAQRKVIRALPRRQRPPTELRTSVFRLRRLFA